MELKFVDPRALKENPDKARRSKSSPQADALLLATIRAVGIVQPPVVAAESDGGNGYVIDAGHRRVKQAIAAGLDEIAVLVIERAEDGGAMRSLAETLAHEHRHSPGTIFSFPSSPTAVMRPSIFGLSIATMPMSPTTSSMTS